MAVKIPIATNPLAKDKMENFAPIATNPLANGAIIKSEKDYSSEKANCEAKGWIWNELTKTCTNPKLTNTQTPEVFTDVQTGEQSGITLPTGETFLGLNREDIAEVNRQYQQKTQLPQGTAPVGTAARQAEYQQAQNQLIENQAPQRVELNPELDKTEGIPIIGSIVKGFEPLFQKIFGENSVPSNQQVLEFAKSDIQRKEIEKGLSWSEAIGAAIEGIPGGDVVTKLLDIERPRGNLEEVMQDIVTQYRRVSAIESNVKSGYLPVNVADEQLKDIEQYILKQEARLRLLIQNSPSLNFNSDRVNGFETDILKVREKIFIAKLNILSGAIKEPTEMELFMKQQEQNEPDWATSPY